MQKHNHYRFADVERYVERGGEASGRGSYSVTHLASVSNILSTAPPPVTPPRSPLAPLPPSLLRGLRTASFRSISL